jgi:hypothetical protein
MSYEYPETEEGTLMKVVDFLDSARDLLSTLEPRVDRHRIWLMEQRAIHGRTQFTFARMPDGVEYPKGRMTQIKKILQQSDATIVTIGYEKDSIFITAWKKSQQADVFDKETMDIFAEYTSMHLDRHTKIEWNPNERVIILHRVLVPVSADGKDVTGEINANAFEFIISLFKNGYQTLVTPKHDMNASEFVSAVLK